MKFIRLLTAYLPISVTRKLTEIGVNRYDFPDDISCEEVNANGVDCKWISPVTAQNDRAVLYLHGGGFVYPASPLHYDMIIYLARKMNTRFLAVDYRLSPKFPFPDPLEDCVTAYRWLLQEGYSSDNITIIGDSAGGHLTIATLMKLRDNSESLPAAAACLSPPVDLTNRDWKDKYDLVLHPRAAHKFNKSFVSDNDPQKPLISPIYGNWGHLPPILVHAGEEEILKEDALRIREISLKMDTEVKVDIYPNMWHVWQLYVILPESKDSLDKISEFLLSHVK